MNNLSLTYFWKEHNQIFKNFNFKSLFEEDRKIPD